MIRFPRLIVLAAPVIGVVVAAIVAAVHLHAVHLRREQAIEEQDRLRLTEKFLRQERETISTSATDSTEAFTRYQVSSIDRALAHLQMTREEHVEPWLAYAFAGPAENTDSEVMVLVWLEDGSNVTGVRLADRNGPLGDYKCFAWDPEWERERSSTLIHGYIPVVLDVVGQKTQKHISRGESVVTLPRQPADPLRCALLFGTDRASPSIEVFNTFKESRRKEP